MSYEFTGKLIEKYDAVQVTEKFKKREFVLEKDEQAGSFSFTNQIKFQLSQDKCALLDNIQLNTEIKVSFNVRGRRWEKDGRVNYLTNLEAWRIESVANGGSSNSGMDNYPDIPADMPSSPMGNDDLPF
ncbi:MAG: DUF3127 domain-containing protein [Bacteroidota bacterium]